jgi:hypothetical protein
LRNSLYNKELAIFSEEPLETQPGFPEVPYIVRQSAGLRNKSATLKYTRFAVFRNIQAALSSERISMRLS